MKFSVPVTIAALGLAGALASTGAYAAPNWAKVPAKDVVLFYPGQSSWEWLLTQTKHPGAAKFRGGKDCAACHIGDEKNIGKLMIDGGKGSNLPLQTTAMPGKPGSIDAKVQIAHDAQNIYVRLVFNEGKQPNSGMDKKFSTMVTMMLASNTVPSVDRGGCFGMCHQDSADMPDAKGADRTMYLPRTRAHLTASGGGDTLVPAAKLAALKAKGYVVDYWQARLNPGKPALGENGVIFAKRELIKPDKVSADASYKAGTWTVTFTRKLDAGAGFIPVADGKRYTVAFAIHAGHTDKRFHYVSFERSLVLDHGNADFVVGE